MKTFQKPLWRCLSLMLLGALAVAFLRPAAVPLEPLPPFSIVGNLLLLDSHSKLMPRLEMMAVGNPAANQSAMRTVGQIIAMANPSGSLNGESISWVELDTSLSQSLGLYLSSRTKDTVGTAYGATLVPKDYAGRINPGQQIEIQRYALHRQGIPGIIWKIRPVQTETGMLNVVFRVEHGQDWFPGTACEVTFPSLRSRAVQIPTTALVHEGIQEYVWVEAGPCRFIPQTVSIVDGSSDEAWVLGLTPGKRIVARGGILLKPELTLLLKQTKG